MHERSTHVEFEHAPVSGSLERLCRVSSADEAHYTENADTNAEA